MIYESAKIYLILDVFNINIILLLNIKIE